MTAITEAIMASIVGVVATETIIERGIAAPFL